MRKVIVQAAAQREAHDAAAWYDSQAPGVGQRFDLAVQAALDQIEEGLVPLRPMPPAAGVPAAKRVILKGFPYDVVVIEKGDEAHVVAVSHHSRRPGYWRSR